MQCMRLLGHADLAVLESPIAQAEAALRLWSGQGTFVFTGSAGIYAQEDSSRVSEDSETQPLGKDERTDRWGVPFAACGASALVSRA